MSVDSEAKAAKIRAFLTRFPGSRNRSRRDFFAKRIYVKNRMTPNVVVITPTSTRLNPTVLVAYGPKNVKNTLDVRAERDVVTRQVHILKALFLSEGRSTSRMDMSSETCDLISFSRFTFCDGDEVGLRRINIHEFNAINIAKSTPLTVKANLYE